MTGQPRLLGRRRFGLLLAVTVATGLAALPAAPQEITYGVTFEGNWTRASTPGGVAPGGHFTTLIGGVHGSGVTFWRAGERASPGVEGVAEEGFTGTFRSEVAASPHTRSVIRQGVAGGGTGSATFNIDVTRTHPRVTLLSMIGPSPDWFVGVSGVSLLDGADEWRESHVVNLFPYDAGTEDGDDFSLSNPDTSPQGVIMRIAGTGPFSNVRMARLTFTRLTTPPPRPNNPPTVQVACEPCAVPRGGEVRLRADASDPDGDAIVYDWSAGQGTFTGATDGPDARWTAPDQIGRVVIRVAVSDDRGGTAAAEVAVEVGNRSPVFGGPLRFELAENRDGRGTPVTLGQVRVTDPDGDDVELGLASGNDRFVIDAASGALSYIGPGEDFEAGPNRYALTVTATDAPGGEARAEVEVQVVDVNEHPAAMDDVLSVPEDRMTRVDVLANDDDPDRGDRIRVVSVGAPGHGQAQVVGAGAAVQYAPDPNYHGPDRFTYVVADGGGLADTATVEVTVTPVNDAPGAADDQATTREDEAVEIPVLDNDSDLDGDRLRVRSVSPAGHGTAEVVADGAHVTYLPDANYHGPDRFTYVVADAGGLTDTATVEVTVTPVNDAPEAADDQATTREDKAIEIPVLDNDADLDGDRLRVRSVSPAGHGAAEVAGGGTHVSYIPDPNYHGPDRFTYVVADMDGLADTATVEVTVVPVNDGPAVVGAIPDQLLDEGADGVAVDLTPFFTDLDGDPLAFTAETSNPDVVAAVVNGPALTLLPVTYGDATVTVTATDPGGLAATQRVTVGVSDRSGRAVLSDAFAAMARSYLSSARMTLERRVAPGARAGGADAGQRSGLRVGGRSVALPDGHTFRDAAQQIVTDWLPDPEAMSTPGAPWPAPDSELSLSDLAPAGASNPLRQIRAPVGISATDFTLAWGGQSADSERPGIAWSLWGQTDVQRYDGGAAELGSGLAGISGDYDGDLRVRYLGLDGQLPNWLFGVALGRSKGAGDWNAGTASGRLSTSMTSVHPYLRWSSGATAIWTTFGAGRGDARNERTATGRVGESPLDLAMGLVEFQRRLGPAGGPVAFGLRADAGWASLSTGEGTETIDDLRGRVHQARLGVDARSEMRVGGAGLAPFGAVHVRHDGGDGRTGRGVELSGGLRTQIGVVGLDLQGRWLAFHSATRYGESGAGLTLTVGGRGEEGFSLSASPRWGSSTGGGLALWQDRAPGMTPGPDAHPTGWTMDVRGAYRTRLRDRLLEVATAYDRASGGQRLQLTGHIGLALANRR
ncbi:MAG: tandem-95 repeat protein [Gammaproteobacteria bacterium]|nr:tandem-95 repeat protein [Gammaproteobacteria bacterium]